MNVPTQSAYYAEESILYQKYHRDYLIHFPGGVSKPSLPVVLVFHGGGGTAKGTASSTGMDAVADRYGFMVVYPEGIGHTWNAGECCGEAKRKNIDDIGFVSALIDKLAASYHIDTSRVFATGISNGSQISYRLACELPSKIAAIAPVAGQSVFKGACSNTRKVAVWHFHGTADDCAKYYGGSNCGGCYGKILPGIGTTWPCDPVEQQIASTAEHNSCTAKSHVVFSKGQVSCSTFDGCPANADVTLCKINGGGHTWPGGNNIDICQSRPNGYVCRKYEEAVGPINTDINASDMMWQFFSSHHL